MPIDVPSRLEPDERRRWRELQAFEAESPAVLSSLLRLASAPLEALIPARAKEAVAAGLGSLLQTLQNASAWTASPEALLVQAAEDGQAGSLSELGAEGEVDRLVAYAEELVGPSKLQATLQGVGLGMGGLLLAAGDVPMLLVMHLRLLTRMGFCFGFDLRAPVERPWLLDLLQLGYSLSDREAKQAALRTLAARLEAEEGETQSRDEMTRALIFKAVSAFSDKVGPILLRRKVSSLVPILGSAFAAGTNFLLTRDVATGARHALLKRMLYNRARARRA